MNEDAEALDELEEEDTADDLVACIGFIQNREIREVYRSEITRFTSHTGSSWETLRPARRIG